MTPQDQALQNRNVQAFLNMIGQPESGGDYSILYGGGHFTDYSTHPNVRVPFFNPRTQKNDYSTAAGKYQINHPTWLMLQAIPGAPSDFTPASQDWLAVTLIKLDGALDDVIAGNLQTALDSCAGTWASLPGSTSGQGKETYARAEQLYTNNGGTLA